MTPFAIFFRIVNAGVVLAYLINVVRKRVLPEFMQDMHKQMKQQKEALDRVTQLQEETALLQEKMGFQKQRHEFLLKNVTTWNTIVTTKRDAAQIVKTERYNVIRAYLTQQAEYMDLAQAKATVMPEVLRNLEKDLAKIYQDPAHQKKYTKDAINNLQKHVYGASS